MKKSRKYPLPKLILSTTVGIGAAVVTACGSKSTSSTPATDAGTSAATTSTSTSSTTTTTGATSNAATVLLNTLAAAVPANLNLAAFSTSTTSSSLMLDDDASKLAGDSPQKELKDRQAVLQGSASSCLSSAFTKAPTLPTDETCYQFDSDMIPVSTNMGGGTGTSAKTYGAKDGKNSNGEACLVAFARAQIVKIKDPLDRSQALLNAALCQANKDEKDKAKTAGKDPTAVNLMPANVGDSLDLAPYLKNALSKGGRTKEVVTSITMKRLADVSSQKVYQTVYKMTDDQSNTRVFTLNHSPKDTSNEEYNGTLYFAVKPPKGKADPMAGNGAQADMTFFVSISYQRSKNTDGTYSMAYEARSARFTNDIDPITSTGLLDYNASADLTSSNASANFAQYKKADGSYYAQANQAANAFNYITVTNTEDKDGKLTGQKIGFWVNPGSNYYENARGMAFSAAPNSTTGLMEGCSVSGSASVNMSSGISIRRMLNENATNSDISLTPRGMYHPFTNVDTGNGQSPVTTNGTGDYKYSKVQNGNQTTQWASIKATGSDAVDFVEKQVAALMTSQCFKQNSTSGKFEIDATKTTGADGYDVIKTTDTVKGITPPPPPKPPLQTAGAGKIDFKPKDGSASLTD